MVRALYHHSVPFPPQGRALNCPITPRGVERQKHHSLKWMHPFLDLFLFFSPCAIHLVERKLLSLKRSSAMFTPQHNPSEQTWRRTGKAVWGVGVSGRSSCWHGRGAPAAGTRSSWLSAVMELTADLPYAHKFCHRTQSTTNFFVISITSWRYTILWRQNVSYATSKKWI